MRHAFIALAGALALSGASSATPTVPAVQLYTLDCGRIAFPSMDRFSDTGDFPARPGTLVATCFLIQHGDDWMLWDTGVGDRIAALPNGKDDASGIHFSMPRSLHDQLAALKLAPSNIGIVALSHLHADHVGNLDLFPKARFLISRLEPRPVELANLLGGVHVDPVDGDLDVFGDGSVQILRTPGHTPGHQSLLVRLPRTGPVLISGDLYHRRESRANRLVPKGNANRADTLASMGRVERLARTMGARVVIQHDPRDIAAMPPFPKALD